MMADTNPSAQLDTIVASASGIVAVASSLQANLAAVTDPATGLKETAEVADLKVVGTTALAPVTMTPEQTSALDLAVQLATSPVQRTAIALDVAANHRHRENVLPQGQPSSERAPGRPRDALPGAGGVLTGTFLRAAHCPSTLGGIAPCAFRWN